MGAAWLRKNGFSVVETELTCFGCREQPDVLGFRSSCSAMVEVKISRSDFLADKKSQNDRRVASVCIAFTFAQKD